MDIRTPSPRFRALLARRRDRDRGATAVEYALILGLIAIVILGSISLLGGRLSSVFNAAAVAIPTGSAASSSSAPAATAPGSINISVTDPGGNTVRVAWGTVSGTTPLSFLIQYDDDQDNGCSTWLTAPGAGNPSTTNNSNWTSTSLGSGDKCVRVIVSNSAGSSTSNVWTGNPDS